ncbi:GIY-YIG nuclease family protein [Corallococcus exiguus]
MLGTIILDSFKKTEAPRIAAALGEICSANDNYGWASTGVYSFFDPQTKETLYLGLAQDFTERFKQHTGLKACAPKFCKKGKIAAYFQQKEKLGFGILAQSPLEQPVLRKNRKERRAQPHDDDLAGLTYAQTGEGQLIEAHRLALGVLPPWNSIGGDKRGQARASEGNIAIVQALCGRLDAFPVARSTLRELADTPLFTDYEVDLHAARLMAQLDSDLLGCLSRLARRGALSKPLDAYLEYLKRTPAL